MPDPTAQVWMKTVLSRCPEALPALERAKKISGQMLPYQAAALFELVHAYDVAGAQILEIGTLAGYSAAVMALAAPSAAIVTINAAGHEIPTAVENLRPYPNVSVMHDVSWELLSDYWGPPLAVVFVDGDHRHADRDVPWFNKLTPGGLILFHDFTPVGSKPVVDAVLWMAERLGRQPDVLIQDARGIGMAGFYRRGGETL